ncbi:HTH-type transcriptional regulator GltR [Roseovarius sp. EC-HK134]|mgnify:CR=1 FL=1|uniref:HTH-type transcriptional regulator GltR n=1 Tax=Roseovarius mucosus TaxID=215743 RepID=A0A1V0RTH3_9RHOB|nr:MULTISPECIES: LysR family transcriptional regulator [Roseovarius]ARE85049.1 HTH-type transcriptional regulator GltR [Roseovarius mucosus]AWZ21129.1 Transcriptional regulator, LysR family [Roseovarius sp. AK1035]EDM33012.1 transcriptional regulator, LysR family protein [Roseovarius sp. TM1035]VVT23125.1 HTH-type transcriptional regulator GltR [Roseovarius sp. EC-SD190]VVT23330.1 HTH-type transcriptional regulator GltR [Roseovarius sp. EC-HK134]
MTPHWDDIRIFLAVARSESLSGAGRILRIDPATVGRRIARLEEELGAPLFAKSPTGYVLSEAGQRLMGPALRAETAMQEATEEMAGQAGGLSGQIRIGAPDGCANFLLPQVCAAIGAENPDLEIQIVALPRVFNLTRREADMVIAVSPPTAGRLTVQKITDYRLHLAATVRYLRSHPPIATLADLRAHRMVGYIPDMIFDKELDYLSEAGIERVSLASNSVSVQLNWVRQGGGIGVLHDFSLPWARGLQKVLPDQFSLTRSFYLVRHADDRRLERQNRFATALVERLRQEVQSLEART